MERSTMERNIMHVYKRNISHIYCLKHGAHGMERKFSKKWKTKESLYKIKSSKYESSYSDLPDVYMLLK